MTFIEDYRKILLRRIKDYHWNDIQIEIKSFFDEIQRANFPRQDCLNKFVVSKTEILEKFSLTQEKLIDPLYLDRIYKLLEYIKEINFECFPNNWFTNKYHHHNHAYNIKRLLEVIEDNLEELIKFKADKFDLLIESQHGEKDFQTKEKFIDLNFKDYELSYYNSYIDLINGIAYHPDFYMILPHLLRSLFENILHDIFSQSLDDSHKDMYYQTRNTRRRDFSRLISLLVHLIKQEYAPYIDLKITPDMIKIMEKIREIGNFSIHDIIEKITTSFAEEWRDKIRITLTPLLISYHKLKGKNIKIDPQREYVIKKELGIIKKDKTVEPNNDLKPPFSKEKPKVEYFKESRAHIDEEAIISKLTKLEKEFDQNITSQKVKSDLNMRIISYPLLNTGELFKISQFSELKDYLEIETKNGPSIDSFPTQIFNNLSVTREGLQDISSLSLIGSILIQRGGLVLYDWRYGLKKDPYNETLPVQIMSAYVLGFLYFLSKFFNKLKYLGEIKIIFNVLNIPNWKYSSQPRFIYNRPKYNFQHSSFIPYECVYTIKELSSKEGKQRLLQEIFNEILLGYGDNQGFKLGDNLTAFLEKN